MSFDDLEFLYMTRERHDENLRCCEARVRVLRERIKECDEGIARLRGSASEENKDE